ncbi:MAG TPA: ABC transporter ATP-binding protein [Nitrososphaerales archaeon]|nr:ABC transporter ATP-binding protein [Nitrososphaerales archaeon]
MAARKEMINERRKFEKYFKLLAYGRKYWQIACLMIGSAIALTILRVLIPLLTGSAVTDILASSSIAYVLMISLEIIGISAVAALFQFALGYGGQYLGQKIIYDMRNRIFVAIQAQSFSFHDRNQTGELMARATGDVEAVRRFLAFGSAQMIGNLLLMAGVVITIFFLSIELVLVVVVCLPVLIIISWKFSQTQAPFWKRSRQNYGEINSALQENISGMKIVRAFSTEEEEIAKFETKNSAYRDDIIGASAVRSFYTPLLTMVISFGLGAVYLIGGFESTGSTATLSVVAGQVVAAGLLVGQLSGPVRFLGQLILLFQNGMAGFERVLEITEASVEVRDKPGAEDLVREKIIGEVSFENVKFGYGKDRMILRGIDLDVKPGEIVAFLGASGSGKTTLANLVPRFYDSSSGSVLIDGIDVRDVTLRSLRSNVGIVSQDIFLFSTTIRENIRNGRPDAPEELVIEAARIAKADEFVNRYPEGYSTLVGERGVTLSGGQKQRIAIARTLITDPKILVLDDSLSSVDVETEFAIQDALKAVVKNRTTIIITQRLSTLRLAKRIVVFKDGLVVEDGSHEVLLAREGEYARLFRSQLAPQDSSGSFSLASQESKVWS